MKLQLSHSVILFPLLAGTASLHILFLFFSQPGTPISDHAGILLWWGCLTLTYGVLTLLLRRPRSMRTVILTAAGGLFLQFILTYFFAYRPPSFLSWFVLLSMWGSMYALCCIRLLEGTQTESVMTVFELSVLVVFLAVFGASVSVMTPASLLYPAVGLLLTLIALVQARSGHARMDAQSLHPQKGRFFLVSILAGMGGVTAAFCVLLTDSASRLLSRITQWGFTLLRAAANQVDRLLRWLLSLLPEQHMNSVLLEEAEVQGPAESAEWGAFDSTLLLYLMLGVIAVLVLVVLVWLWKQGSFHRIVFHSRTVAQSVRKRPGLRDLFLQLRQRLGRWLSFNVSYLKLRNTAPGLFVWLERQMRARHLERESGETARAFLLRIQTVLPSCSEPLIRLADCLDQHYFGTGQTLSAPEITAMRRQISAELHQHPHEKAADT